MDLCLLVRIWRETVRKPRTREPLFGSTPEQRAPVYGLAATILVRGAIDDMLTQYMDLLYRV